MVFGLLDSVKASIANLGNKDKNITGAAFEKLKGMDLNSESLNWLTSDVVEYIVNHNPLQIKHKLSLLLTAVSNLFWVTKDNIKDVSSNVFTKLLKYTGNDNKNLYPFLDTIYSFFSNPEVIEEGIQKLAVKKENESLGENNIEKKAGEINDIIKDACGNVIEVEKKKIL